MTSLYHNKVHNKIVRDYVEEFQKNCDIFLLLASTFELFDIYKANKIKFRLKLLLKLGHKIHF